MRHPVGTQKCRRALGPHAVMAIHDNATIRVGREFVDHLGKGTEGNPFVARNLADLQFIILAAIDESGSLIDRKLVPLRHRPRTDFQGRLRIRERGWE